MVRHHSESILRYLRCQPRRRGTSPCRTIQPVTQLLNADRESASSLLAFDRAALVNDPDFNESEHPLVVEVARSLQQRLDEIIRTWTIAIPPDQPFAELIVGG
jgi:hypothetical protein